MPDLLFAPAAAETTAKPSRKAMLLGIAASGFKAIKAGTIGLARGSGYVVKKTHIVPLAVGAAAYATTWMNQGRFPSSEATAWMGLAAFAGSAFATKWVLSSFVDVATPKLSVKRATFGLAVFTAATVFAPGLAENAVHYGLLRKTPSSTILPNDPRLVTKAGPVRAKLGTQLYSSEYLANKPGNFLVRVPAGAELCATYAVASGDTPIVEIKLIDPNRSPKQQFTAYGRNTPEEFEPAVGSKACESANLEKSGVVVVYAASAVQTLQPPGSAALGPNIVLRRTKIYNGAHLAGLDAALASPGDILCVTAPAQAGTLRQNVMQYGGRKAILERHANIAPVTINGIAASVDANDITPAAHGTRCPPNIPRGPGPHG